MSAAWEREYAVAQTARIASVRITPGQKPLPDTAATAFRTMISPLFNPFVSN
jgi:hypothetical protein